MATEADGVLLVVEAGRTRRQVVELALDQFAGSRREHHWRSHEQTPFFYPQLVVSQNILITMWVVLVVFCISAGLMILQLAYPVVLD